jgi:putative mRNA 3-end processing factor
MPAPQEELVVARPEGLYCPPGDFYIDPWRPVARAIITHAHSDHARVGHAHYLAHTDSEGTLRTRLGQDINLQTLPYGEAIEHHGVRVSLHPAGHVLGSAQVRLEHGGRVWVASGDYKTEPDGTCTPFEPVPCDTFITESTFGLPIYRWPTQAVLFAEIDAWWRANAQAGRASVLFCYAFGKAQRILHGVDASIGPIVVHGAVEPLNAVYRAAGVALPPTLRVSDEGVDAALLKRSLVLAPPSAQGTPWMKRFGNYADAFASGWMQLRGTRRRRGVDRGFVMSDHADWPGLQQAIAGTGAERVFVTHGSVQVMVRWLTEIGLDARGFKTEYGDEDDQDAPSRSAQGQGKAPDAPDAPAAPAAPAAPDSDAGSPHPGLPPEREGETP